MLDGVTVIPVGAPVPVVRTDRRNARYSAVLPLASLVLSGASIEQRAGSHIGAGFLVDMWSVFEDFVTASLREAFRPYGGELEAKYSSTLDVEGTVKIEPDLVWFVDGEVRACIDVKYKVEKHGQYPNADLYQMTAYCRRFGLGEGHLVYAAGDDEPRVVVVIDGPAVRQHALDLDRSVDHIVIQLASLLERRIAARSSA